MYLRGGVSTLVASLFILMIIAMSFIYVAYMISQLGSLANKVVEVANEAVLRSKVRLSVVNTYVNASGLVIVVKNNGTVTATINAYSVRDLSTGKSIYGTFSNPYVVPPATSVTIVIPGTFSSTGNYLVSLGGTYGYVVKGTYPPPPPPTTAALQTPTLATTPTGTSVTLNTIATQGTVTWAGTALVPNYFNITSNVTAAEVNGALVTNYAALQSIDGNNLTVTNNEVTYTLELTLNKTVLWDDFITNPLGTRVINVSGTWVYDSTYHGIYQSDYTQRAAIAYFPASNLSIGHKYFIVTTQMINDTDYRIGFLRYCGWASVMVPYTSLVTPSIMSGMNLTTLFSTFPYRMYVEIDQYVPTSTPPVSLLSNSLAATFPLTTIATVLTTYDYALPTTSINAEIEPYGVSTSATNTTSFTWGRLALITSYASAEFYDILVTDGVNPLYVNITNVPSGWNITLRSGTLTIASNISKGTPVGNVSLYLLQNYLNGYIVRNPEFLIYNSTGNLVLDYKLPFTVLGGMVFNLTRVYSVNVTSYVRTSTSIPVRAIYLCTSLSSNVTSKALIKAYDFSTSSFDTIAIVNVNKSLSTCFKLSSVSDYVNASGYSIFSIVTYSPSPLNITVDLLNARVATYNFTQADTLVVGVGGTQYINVFKLVPTTTGLYLSYLGSMNASSYFDGSTDLVFDALTTKSLIMVNRTGVYNTSLLVGHSWHLISTSCRALGRGVRAELLGNYLVVLEGGDTSDYCVLDLSTGTVVSSGLVGTNLVCGDYCVSASNGSVMYALMLYNNSGILTPQVWGYSVGRGWFLIGNFTGYKSVGMAYGVNKLYVMLEYGALYSIDPLTGSYSRLNVVLTFYPVGYGDRLEYYGGKLIFVRGDSTSEVWVITP